jgi:hypothetical protein
MARAHRLRASHTRLAPCAFSPSRLCFDPKVIILSAALDLVSNSTPKGLVAFFNIFPALIAKVGWPYISKGRIRYKRRICGCAALSFTGMLVSCYSRRDLSERTPD